MTRFVSWIGWSAAIFALVAALVVAHGLRSPYRPATPRVALRSGATFASLRVDGAPRLVVTSLRSGGAGQAAGLRVGDRIVDVDGLPAPTIEAFNKDVANGSYGDVDVRVERGTALLDIHIKRMTRG